MMKKIASLLIALVMVLSLSVTAFAAEDSWPAGAVPKGDDCHSINSIDKDYCLDPCCRPEALEAWFAYYKGETASTWAQDAIKESIRTRCMGTWDVNYDGVFHYKSDITRKEFMVMVVGTISIETNTSIGVLIESAIPPEVMAGDLMPILIHANAYSPYMTAAQWMGITDGTGYDNLLTREQAATIMMRVANLIDIINHTEGPLYHVTDLTAKVQASIDTPCANFADMDQVSAWASGGVSFVKANGLMNGTGGNKFSPKSNLTVEQAIVMLNHMK